MQQTLTINYAKLNSIKHKTKMNVFVVVSDIIKEQVTLHNRTKHTMLAIMDKSCAEESATYPDIPLHIFLNNVKDNFTQPFEVGDVLRIHNLMGDFYPKEQKMYAKIFWSKSVVKFKLTEENNKVTPITTNTAYRLTEQDTNLVRELRLFWRKLVQQKERERLMNERLSTKKICDVTSPCTFSANCLVKNIQFKNTESVAVLTVTDLINNTTGNVIKERDVTVFEPLSKKVSTLKVGQSIRLVNIICTSRSKGLALVYSNLDFYMTSEKGEIKQIEHHVCNLVSISSDEEAPSSTQTGAGEEPSCSKQPERLVQNSGATSSRILTSDKESQSTETPPSGQLEEELDCEIIEPERVVINLDDSDVSEAQTNDSDVSEAQTNDSNVSEAQTNDSDVSEAQTNDSNVSKEKTNDSHLSEAPNNDSALSEAQNNERSDNYSEETNEATMMEDDEGSDSRIFVKGLDTRTDIYVFKSPECSMILGNDGELENQTLRDNSDTDNTQDSEVLGEVNKVIILENGEGSGGGTQEYEDGGQDSEESESVVVAKSVTKKRKVPPESSLELANDEGEVNKESDGEGSGGGTQEYKDGGLDSEESESVVVAKSVTKKRKVPPESSLELANDEGEVNKVIILENGEGSGGGTQEYEDGGQDSEESESVVVAKSVTKKRKVPPESSLELANDEGEVNKVIILENGEGSGGGTQEYEDGGQDSEESESVVVAKSVTKKRKVPPESSLELANDEGEVNKESDGEGSGGGTQEYEDGGLDLEEAESVVVAKSVTKKRKVPPESSLELANDEDEMEEVSVAADEDSCVERTGDNKSEGRVERTGDNDNTENPVEPPVSPMVLEKNNGLENQAPIDDGNSSQQSEPRNITSESDSGGKKRIRKRRKKRSYDFINMDYKFWNNSKPGEMGSVWCRLISIDFVSREPCSKCIDVNCYHDWTWGMCRECGAEFSSAQLRNSFSTSDLIKYKALPCFECTTPSDAATIKPQFRLTVCLKDLISEADFNVELSGDFAEEFLGTQPTFKWTVEEAPENFDDKITQFHRECLRRPLVLVVNKICSIDGTTSLRFCQAKLTT
ncbi:hypothetical protein Avbf_01934 [Armadillidium vulgare]|nr:hypothetical protein Avbf_01934 [Armadillidium vulgare]